MRWMISTSLAGILTLSAAAVFALSPAAAGSGGVDSGSPTDSLSFDGLTRERLTALYASLAGAQFQPPACVVGQEMFTDVPASSPFCPWIEELARRGITGGCTATQYCPGSAVTRTQMAVFVVRSMEVCPTLDPTDEMLRIGGVCIDKYEASIWDAPVGGNQITGALPCSANGQDCTNIYARSVAGVLPRADITWFQAQAALANSGKRLPTNAEWQMAVRGTPDNTNCNVSTFSPANTGSFGNCVSSWGTFDMVGNLEEWVADWVPASTVCPGWGGFSDDSMCLAGASTTDQGPGALVRGGRFVIVFAGGTDAGPFAVSGDFRPSSSRSHIGFRGAR